MTDEPVPVSAPRVAPLLNPANVLTVIRIVLVPVFLGLVTAFGKVADPIADKALTGTALVLLSWYGALPWWVTALILARELGVTALRFFVLRYGVIPASRGGKVKTALQVLAISWYLWPFPDPVAAVGHWIMAAAVIVTVATGLDYAIRALRLRRLAG